MMQAAPWRVHHQHHQNQGCGITRGFSNHVCDTFWNPPLYAQNSLWEALSVVSQKWSFPTARTKTTTPMFAFVGSDAASVVWFARIGQPLALALCTPRRAMASAWQNRSPQRSLNASSFWTPLCMLSMFSAVREEDMNAIPHADSPCQDPPGHAVSALDVWPGVHLKHSRLPVCVH